MYVYTLIYLFTHASIIYLQDLTIVNIVLNFYVHLSFQVYDCMIGFR